MQAFIYYHFHLQVSWEVLLISFGPTYASALSFADLGWALSSVLVSQLAVGWPTMLSQLRHPPGSPHVPSSSGRPVCAAIE